MDSSRYHALVSAQLILYVDGPSQKSSSYLVESGHHRPLLVPSVHSQPGAPKISVERKLLYEPFI